MILILFRDSSSSPSPFPFNHKSGNRLRACSNHRNKQAKLDLFPSPFWSKLFAPFSTVQKKKDVSCRLRSCWVGEWIRCVCSMSRSHKGRPKHQSYLCQAQSFSWWERSSEAFLHAAAQKPGIWMNLLQLVGGGCNKIPIFPTKILLKGFIFCFWPPWN